MKDTILNFFRKDRGLGVALERGRYDLPLVKDEGTNFLRLLVALMSFLTAMAMIGTLTLNTIAEKWSSGLENKLTIEIPVERPDGSLREKDDVEFLLKKVESALKENKDVKTIKILEDTDIKKLLEPWLGKDTEIEGIPLPGLIAVDMKASNQDIINRINQGIKSIDSTIVVDTHESWLQGLLRMISSLRMVILIVIGIIGFTTVTAIAGAIRSRIAVHRADLELLHLMGASDEYIVRQFQRHALVLALQGAIIGTLSALGLAFLVKLWTAQGEGSLLPSLSLGLSHTTLLVILPIAACLISALTARFTVLRSLSQMP
ncbi:MAG: permease [Alphaproteobacteria bacterium]